MSDQTAVQIPATEPVRPLQAADLLKSKHSLYQTFQDWCINRGTEPTRRQAAKFLQAFPAYRRTVTG